MLLAASYSTSFRLPLHTFPAVLHAAKQRPSVIYMLLQNHLAMPKNREQTSERLSIGEPQTAQRLVLPEPNAAGYLRVWNSSADKRMILLVLGTATMTTASVKRT